MFTTAAIESIVTIYTFFPHLPSYLGLLCFIFGLLYIL